MATSPSFWNIFLEELITVLHQRTTSDGKPYELGNLYGLSLDGVRIINPSKVQTLINATAEGLGGTLNARELSDLAKRLKFSPDEIRRLKIALFAEAIRLFILDRARKEWETYELEQKPEATALAYDIGSLTYDLLESISRKQLSMVSVRLEQILASFREDLGLPNRDLVQANLSLPNTEQLSANESAIASALAPAADRYMRGSLWLESARQMPDRPQRLAMAVQAINLLHSARALAEDVALGTDQQHEWLNLIDQEITAARALG